MFTRSPRAGTAALLFQTSLVAAVLGIGAYFDQAWHEEQFAAPRAGSVQHALQREEASQQVRAFIGRVLETGDHGGLPFLVVDKVHARIYAFGPLGHLRGTAPVLLGAARADEPGPPATPAGRFASSPERELSRDTMAWTHDGIQVSLYPLPSARAPGRGLQRLASARLEDRRISEGSLHVASGFYREYIDPLAGGASVAYVLPETDLDKLSTSIMRRRNEHACGSHRQGDSHDQG